VNRYQLKSELSFGLKSEPFMMESVILPTREDIMSQVHKRLSDAQIAFVLQQYAGGVLSRTSAQEVLGISKTRFFALLRAYRQQPAAFSTAYHRASPGRLSAAVEEAMVRELQRERQLVEDPTLPISDYNYSAVRDRLQREGIRVSLTTLIARAKALGCYQHRTRKRRVHDRQVLTDAVGALIQHDASTHRWSPCAEGKWTLIASLDDYSRVLLYAEFVPQETTWAHIQAVRQVVETYGVPLAYYVDSLRVFRFVQHRDSVWRKELLGSDQADPQWKQVMRLLDIHVTYALSPQAKGKIERPFRWLQDRIVRTCALEQIGTIEEGRRVLQEEVARYNAHQRHTTTGEIPAQRLAHARSTGNTLFRPYVLPHPYTVPEDVFCLRVPRVTDGYRRIRLESHVIEVPKVLPREPVEVHLIPEAAKQVMHVRLWWEGQLVGTTALPLQRFGVHF